MLYGANGWVPDKMAGPNAERFLAKRRSYRVKRNSSSVFQQDQFFKEP